MSEGDRPLPATVSPEARTYLAANRPIRQQAESPAEWMRLQAEYEDLLEAGTATARARWACEVETKEVRGVPVMIVTPKGYDSRSDGRAAYYIHGGSYTYGSPKTSLPLSAAMAAALGLRVHAVGYRLAPQHPFPAGRDDCLAVYRALVQGVGPEHLLVFGDSAGGGLALATLLEARAQGLPLPAALALFSPWADISRTGDSYDIQAGWDPDCDYDLNLAASAEAYAGARALTDPAVSPLYADYAEGFPPTLITTATRDLLLSDSARLQRTLRRTGVEVELSLWEGLWHVFEWAPGVPEAEESIREVADFLLAHGASR